VARRVWTVQRIHRGELIYKNASSSIRETVSKVVDTLVDVSRREGVEVSPEWDSFENLPNLFLDRDVFFEAILNVVDNAIKYSSGRVGGRRPQVIVKAWQTAGEIILSVGNRGIEIPEEEVPRIFERYYRTAQAKRLKPDGSGIGLSIVKDFVEHYGYEIEVKSDPIPGTADYLTRFEIHLKKGG
jgi:signal transduction histidine kinase